MGYQGLPWIQVGRESRHMDGVGNGLDYMTVVRDLAIVAIILICE